MHSAHTVANIFARTERILQAASCSMAPKSCRAIRKPFIFAVYSQETAVFDDVFEEFLVCDGFGMNWPGGIAIALLYGSN